MSNKRVCQASFHEEMHTELILKLVLFHVPLGEVFAYRQLNHKFCKLIDQQPRVQAILKFNNFVESIYEECGLDSFDTKYHYKRSEWFSKVRDMFLRASASERLTRDLKKFISEEAAENAFNNYIELIEYRAFEREWTSAYYAKMILTVGEEKCFMRSFYTFGSESNNYSVTSVYMEASQDPSFEKGARVASLAQWPIEGFINRGFFDVLSKCWFNGSCTDADIIRLLMGITNPKTNSRLINWILNKSSTTDTEEREDTHKDKEISIEDMKHDYHKYMSIIEKMEKTRIPEFPQMPRFWFPIIERKLKVIFAYIHLAQDLRAIQDKLPGCESILKRIKIQRAYYFNVDPRCGGVQELYVDFSISLPKDEKSRIYFKVSRTQFLAGALNKTEGSIKAFANDKIEGVINNKQFIDLSNNFYHEGNHDNNYVSYIMNDILGINWDINQIHLFMRCICKIPHPEWEQKNQHNIIYICKSILRDPLFKKHDLDDMAPPNSYNFKFYVHREPSNSENDDDDEDEDEDDEE